MKDKKLLTVAIVMGSAATVADASLFPNPYQPMLRGLTVFTGTLDFWLYMVGITMMAILATGSYRSRVVAGSLAWLMVTYPFVVVMVPLAVSFPGSAPWFVATFGVSFPMLLSYFVVSIGVRMFQSHPKEGEEQEATHDDTLRQKIVKGVGSVKLVAVSFDAIHTKTSRLPSDWQNQLARIKETEPEFLMEPEVRKRGSVFKWFGLDVAAQPGPKEEDRTEMSA